MLYSGDRSEEFTVLQVKVGQFQSNNLSLKGIPDCDRVKLGI